MSDYTHSSCKMCARPFKWDREQHDEIPDGHAAVGETCPTTYHD
jgi:hypothetical protein